MLLEKVKRFAKHVYPAHMFRNHILPAVDIAGEFADTLDANKRNTQIAAYLHDIGRVPHPFHAAVGNYVSRVVLRWCGCPKKDIDEICYCIRVHEGKKGFNTIEAEIVANADAVSQFENFLYMFSLYYSTHGKDIDKTKRWLKDKYQRDYTDKLTLNIAKERADAAYKGFRDLLL
jgi:HD superfamily phosphodiesterase